MARSSSALEVGRQAGRTWTRRWAYRWVAALLVLALGACGGSGVDRVDAPAQQSTPPAAETYDAQAPDVPFVDQLHPAGADASYDGTEFCGPALLAGIAKARGSTFGLADAGLVSFLAVIASTDPATGTTGNGMIFALTSLGLQTDASKGADLDWVDAELTAGHDVIANGNYYAVPGREQPGLAAGHYIAVTAAGDGWSRYKVTDPADARVTSLTDEELSTFIASHPEGGFTLSAW
jgi:hypothetical protein